MCVSLQWKTQTAGVGDKAFYGSSRCLASDIWRGSNASPIFKKMGTDEDEDVAINSQTSISAVARISDAKMFPNGVVSLSQSTKTIVPVTITCFNASHREHVDVTFDATDITKDEKNNLARKEWTTTATDITSSLTQLDINKEEDGNNNSTGQRTKEILLRERSSLSPFAWVRETRKTIRRVPPGATVHFDASLLVFKPGAFHVDNFKVYFAPSSLKETDADEADEEEEKSNSQRLASSAGFSLFVV